MVSRVEIDSMPDASLERVGSRAETRTPPVRCRTRALRDVRQEQGDQTIGHGKYDE